MKTDTISLIGFGNVGSHLAKHLNESGVQISHIYTRNSASIEEGAHQLGAIATSSFQDLPAHQLTLICVTDDAIHKVVEQLSAATPVAYTSGSVALNSLPQKKDIGVFYPLQTFSKDRELDVSSIPFLIEASTEEFGKQLYDLASKLSSSVAYADSQKRKELHLAAVWVNNFTNHVVHLAQKYADENNVDFNLLTPLLKETINKLDGLSAYDAQTGPARRGDLSILQEQASKLTGLEKELYQLISKSIQNTYTNNGEL